jgi:hypothetical protein
VSAPARNGGLPLQSWENEGGRLSTTDEPHTRVTGGDVPAGLDWYAFVHRYFPGRRRHDLEALKAYEAYRSAGVTPNTAHQSRTAARFTRVA